MKKILFPFEVGNPIYKEAYVYAVKFARNLHTELILLNTFKLDVGSDITRENYAMLVRQKWIKAYVELSKYNQYYLENHARADDEMQIKLDHRFIHGIFKEEVNRAAAHEEVGTIVLPLSDSRDFSRRQLEIFQENVLMENRVSVLVIPGKMIYRPVKNIVFLTNLKSVNLLHPYLNDAVRYAAAMDSKIHFLHFTGKDPDSGRKDSESYRMIMDTTARYRQHVFKEVSGSNLIASIMQYAGENNADLLVAIKQQHPLLEALFRRSVSNELSLTSPIPVLVMREKKE